MALSGCTAHRTNRPRTEARRAVPPICAGSDALSIKYGSRRRGCYVTHADGWFKLAAGPAGGPAAIKLAGQSTPGKFSSGAAWKVTDLNSKWSIPDPTIIRISRPVEQMGR